MRPGVLEAARWREAVGRGRGNVCGAEDGDEGEKEGGRVPMPAPDENDVDADGGHREVAAVGGEDETRFAASCSLRPTLERRTREYPAAAWAARRLIEGGSVVFETARWSQGDGGRLSADGSLSGADIGAEDGPTEC